MNAQGKELRFEGIVRAQQEMGAFVTAIEYTDGKRWVIDYCMWAPYHVFADRRVLVSGEPGRCLAPCSPRTVPEFRVRTIRLVEVTPDDELIEVGAPEHLSGRFKRGAYGLGEPTLSFVTEQGNTFLVANDPSEVSIGCILNILASPVTLSPSCCVGVAFGLWQHDIERNYGAIQTEGIHLCALHEVGPDFVAWQAIEAVVRVRHPLFVHYQLELKDGSAVRVDYLNEEQLAPQLKEHRVGFRRCDWTGTEAR